jgi:hypothetical protein
MGAAGPWGVVVPVGPGAHEVDRVVDLLDALATYEPGVSRVVLVDDAPDLGRDLAPSAGSLEPRTTVVVTDRRRDVQGWSEGVLIATSTGLAELVSATAPSPVDWALRLDTDSMVIGPFAERVGTRFAGDPRLGMVGAHEHLADGSVRAVGGWGTAMRRFRLPLSVWRRPQPQFRTALIGVGRERKAVIDEALGRGYRVGEHCQGGGFAITTAAARAMAERGWLDGHLWHRTGIAEDVAISVQVRAVGYTLSDMVGPGEPFAVQHEGLGGEPAELVDAGYGVVHSIKTFGHHTEDGLRAEFRRLRSSESAG